MLTGSGIRNTSAGEIWHLLDTRYQMPLTMVDQNRISRINLNDYTTLILPDGNISVSSSFTRKLKVWLEQGGTVISLKSSNNWLKNNGLINFDRIKKEEKNTDKSKIPYADMRNLSGAQYIGGAIFKAYIDNSHPIAYGFNQNELAVFKSSASMYKKHQDLGSTPLFFEKNPLMAGYISKENARLIENSTYTLITKLGRGIIVSFTEDPNFRGFWYGTNKLFANAIFFSHIINCNCTASDKSRIVD